MSQPALTALGSLSKTHFDKDRDTSLILKRYEIESAIRPFFDSYKNPKIFLFYMFLIEIFLLKGESKIFFDFKKVCYRYNICEKTIRLWINELSRLELIKYNYKDGKFIFLEVLDYKKSKIFFEDLPQDENTLTQDLKQFPIRFFKDMQSIVNKIVKRNESNIYRIDNALWRLRRSMYKYFEVKDVMIEFESVECPNEIISLNYETLTREDVPPLEHPFHQEIMRSKIKKALANFIDKGDNDEYYKKIA